MWASTQHTVQHLGCGWIPQLSQDHDRQAQIPAEFDTTPLTFHKGTFIQCDAPGNRVTPFRPNCPHTYPHGSRHWNSERCLSLVIRGLGLLEIQLDIIGHAVTQTRLLNLTTNGSRSVRVSLDQTHVGRLKIQCSHLP